MPQDTEYIGVLKDKLEQVRQEIAGRQARIGELTSELEQKQALAQHLVELLRAENVRVDSTGISGSSNQSVAEIAYGELSSLSVPKPHHYKDLARILIAKGAVIPGKVPAANLLAHMSRDSRFVRVGPGTYGLAEWGVRPAAGKGKSRRRRRKKSG